MSSNQQRHSVPYFSSAEFSSPEGNAFLLARDISLGIMPLGATGRNANFDIELSPADAEQERTLTKFLSIGQYKSNSLKDALVDFVDTSANYLAYRGEVYFEIFNDESGQPLSLSPLPPGRLLAAPNRKLQLIPREDRNELGLGRWVTIPNSAIWRVAFPRELGTARNHRRLLRKLATGSKLMPAFALNSGDLGRKQGYDFTAHRVASDRLTERATKRWGSVPSLQRPVEGSTEFYFISRRIEFLRAQARLREHLVRELNRLLKKRGIKHEISMAGIPTADTIQSSLQQLHAGKLSLSETLDATRT
jgi:hypothetical protein